MMDTQTATRPVTTTHVDRRGLDFLTTADQNLIETIRGGWREGLAGSPLSWYARVQDEALYENDHFDALRLNELGHEGLASLVHTPPSGNVVITMDADSLVALRQAEALTTAPTDAQRRKLRELVTAKLAAERKVQELSAELSAPITADDKRIWPIFARVALAANAHNYCSEYEAMGDEAGIPSRQELMDAGFTINASSYVALVSVTLTRTVRIPVGSHSDEDQAKEYASRAIGSWQVEGGIGDDESVVDWSIDEVEVR